MVAYYLCRRQLYLFLLLLLLFLKISFRVLNKVTLTTLLSSHRSNQRFEVQLFPHMFCCHPLRPQNLKVKGLRMLARPYYINLLFLFPLQPFPGPGLAVRIIGRVTKERVNLLQKADKIVEEEIKKANLYNKVWQAFAVLLPLSSVGVMGDNRTYEETIALRIVDSSDGMTASWSKIPYSVLEIISSRIVGEVRGVNRVVYDISNKPPATIEWE